MHLYPAILTESLTEAQEQLNIAQQHPAITNVQIDVIDGFYADAVTISPLDLLELDPGNLTYDLHLMTTEPQDFVFETVAIKKQLPVRAIIAQVEKMSFQGDYLSELKTQGWLAGLSLDLFTPVEAIDPDSWAKLDIIQLMAIEAGSQGQPFHPLVLAKIAEVRKILDELDHPVELVIDGGVKLDTIDQLQEAGVDGVGVGSALWRSPDPVGTLSEFMQACQ